jgi:ribosome biogenesis protein ERB1
MKTFELGGGESAVVRSVEWCPNKSLSLLAIAIDSDVFLVNPGVGDKLVVKKTDTLLKDELDQGDYKAGDKVSNAVTWEPVDELKWAEGIRVVIRHFKRIHQASL